MASRREEINNESKQERSIVGRETALQGKREEKSAGKQRKPYLSSISQYDEGERIEEYS